MILPTAIGLSVVEIATAMTIKRVIGYGLFLLALMLGSPSGLRHGWRWLSIAIAGLWWGRLTLVASCGQSVTNSGESGLIVASSSALVRGLAWRLLRLSHAIRALPVGVGIGAKELELAAAATTAATFVIVSFSVEGKKKREKLIHVRFRDESRPLFFYPRYYYTFGRQPLIMGPSFSVFLALHVSGLLNPKSSRGK